MNFARLSLLTAWIAFAPVALAHDHPAKHGMVLMGTTEVFASHIVAPSPHNYQVSLAITLLLDPVDIAAIASAERLSGAIFDETPDGRRQLLVSNVTLERQQSQLRFFHELALADPANSPQAARD